MSTWSWKLNGLTLEIRGLNTSERRRMIGVIDTLIDFFEQGVSSLQTWTRKEDGILWWDVNLIFNNEDELSRIAGCFPEHRRMQ